MKMILSSKQFVLCILRLFAAISVSAAPRIECDEPAYDFGTLIGQNELVHEFTVWNRGDSALTISKVRACCGMKASMDSMTIAPGSNATCHVVFDLSSRRGAQNKQVWLACDDPEHPYLDLRLTGIHRGAIEATPEALRFDKVVAGRSEIKVLTVTNLLEEAVSLSSITSDVKGVEAELIESAGRSWVIQVTAKPVSAQDRMNGALHLNFSSGTVRVPVWGSAVPLIKPVPAQIVFHAGSETSVERLVVLSSSDGRPFEVVSADLIHAEGEVALKKLRPDRWQCTLSVLPGSIAFGASLHIVTDSDAQPEVTVPLELRSVRP